VGHKYAQRSFDEAVVPAIAQNRALRGWRRIGYSVD
jgi:hypothetical protein